MNIFLTIPGEPKGKGRPKFVRKGNFVSTYTPETTVNYENLVKICYKQFYSIMLEGELEANITAYFTIPKSVSNKKRIEMITGLINPTKKPDADNIAKIILDSLNGIAYKDDSQIVKLNVIKKWSDKPRVELEIKDLEGLQC